MIRGSLRLVVFVALCACAGGNQAVNECDDGEDNDGDGFVDADDPACQAGYMTENPTPACRDGEDNDGDGQTDHPADPDCESPDDLDEAGAVLPACRDGVDNDFDGKTDFPNDPGCTSADDGSEPDACPSGGTCPACSNGRDDEGDGQTDYPNDDGCASAADTNEFVTNPAACGADVPVISLGEGGFASGDIQEADSNLSSFGGCGGDGDERAYEIIVNRAATLVATTHGSSLPASIYLRPDCTAPATEVACNNDFGDASEATLNTQVQPGIYYLVVDADAATDTGAFALEVHLYLGEGEACAPESSECAPGFVCRVAAGATEPTCTDPVCSDGVDDDGDGKVDYPADPGCASRGGDSETDDCPSGPNCPDCANGADDDGDGEIDYPNDLECLSAGQLAEACGMEMDPISVIDMPTETGTTGGAGANYTPSCDDAGAPDRVYTLQLPVPVRELTIDTVGSALDTVLVLADATCGQEMDCNDEGTDVTGPSLISAVNVPAGSYSIIVDGYNGLAGAYTLNVQGVVAATTPCTDPLFAAGVLVCEAGTSCNGAICAGIYQCNNGTDDDGDGKNGFPFDPGCDSAMDNTEVDTCPGGNCPECSDGMDNDGDGQTDYPNDTSCSAASTDSEACATVGGITAITSATTMGNSTGAINEFALACGSSNAIDDVYLLSIPGTLQTLTIDTIGSVVDTVIELRTPSCTSTPGLGCDDDSAGAGDSRLTRTNVAAGRYFLIVSDYENDGDAYVIHVSGIIASGGRCTPGPGMFTCALGVNCVGAPGAEVCTP